MPGEKDDVYGDYEPEKSINNKDIGFTARSDSVPSTAGLIGERSGWKQSERVLKRAKRSPSKGERESNHDWLTLLLAVFCRSQPRMNKVTWLRKGHDTKMQTVAVRVWAQKISIQKRMFIKMECLFHP
jgi:hypothetical protein